MKKSISILFTFLFLFTTLISFAAVKIVECEDEQGNRSFQKTCPPGFTIVGEKSFKTGTGSNENKSTSAPISINATLYMIPVCDTCNEVKEFLSSRGVSITEKNVSDDVELQKELTDLSGSLKVPTTVIGKEILTGYNRGEFQSVLKAAGYIEEAETNSEKKSEEDS